MNSTRTIQTFSLSLPYAPEMIELVPGDETSHGGVAIDDANAAEGFLVLMLAYLNQAENDRLELCLNDIKVDDTTIAQGKEQNDTPLRIPPGLFQKGLNRIKVSLRRSSGNQDSTKDLILLHRTSPPGDTPPVLNFSVSHKNIGPVEADKVAGTLSYQNMQWYDLIIVSCNGVQIRHTLQPDSTAPLPPLPQNVVIPIPRSVLEQGGDDPTFEFKFRVVDYLTNPSGPPTWSNSVFVDVHLNRLTLPVAVLREIPTENNDDPAIVDLAKMKGGPLWALVHLVETLWSVGDSIYLKFTAELDGNPVASHEETLPVTQVGTQLAWDIPNAKVVANSSVRMTYALIRNGATIATSTPAIAEVIGASTGELLPPFLVSPAVTPIDVLASSNGVTLRVEFLNAEPKDKGRLALRAPEGAPTFPLVEFNANKRINTVLSQAFLASCQGKVIEALWNLNRDGGQVGKSPVAKFSVLKIANHDPRLPTPVIAGQTGAELNVDQLKYDDQLTVGKWPHLAEEQLNLELLGIKEDGTSGVWELVVNGPSSPPGFSFPVPLDVLYSLKSGTSLTVRFSVSNYGPDKLTILFPVRVYTVVATFLPIKDIQIGHTTRAIRITSDGLRAFVPSYVGPNSMAVLDLRNSRILTSFNLGSSAFHVELSKDDRFAYIPLYDQGSLGIFDANSYTLIDSIQTGAGAHDVKLSSDGKLAYVTNRGPETLSIIDLPGRRVINTILGMKNLYDLVIAPDNTKAYISAVSIGSKFMYSVNLTTREIVTIPTPSGGFGIAITLDGTRLFISHPDINKVSVIDTRSDSITQTLTVGSAPAGICISPDGLSAIVCNITSSTLSIINTKTLTITTTPASNRPLYMDISPNGRIGYTCSNHLTWINAVALR